jgi:two-component system cell cycle response regulator
MSARVLVVDDIPANVKLLEAKLRAEYFDVLTAPSGSEALEIIRCHKPDIVLLDVMMPGMDGFEVCRRIKSASDTRHIPVVIVTALDQSEDRVRGLEAGADDFLTKPVDDVALFARTKSLVRLKMTLDELRMRQSTGVQFGLIEENKSDVEAAIKGRILIVEDRELVARQLADSLGREHEVVIESRQDTIFNSARANFFDLAVVSLSMKENDGLRLCSKLRSMEETRGLPIIALVEYADTPGLVRALELGINDYVMRPVDRNELMARVRTQLKQKLYTDRLRENFQISLEMAVTDSLTGLYNRRYMESHLTSLLSRAVAGAKPLSLLIVDIDFFKAINDTHGHDVGDEVLREFATRLATNVRGIDLGCRYGGEEFVVVMPDTDISFAYMVAERLRQQVAEVPFEVPNLSDPISVTVSIGITCIDGPHDNAASLLKRADEALYRAKNEGRNRVIAEAA